MASRKLKPIEGDLCWFCKQPADAGSWMDLGELKSTHEPVFEGTHYILYHEPCAVYSNGANVSLAGMDDQTVLQFWLHGERCSGIGLKCQLCGLRGATTGCLHGPCQQFYHYPCARVRAFQGYLQFSPTCRALACEKHLVLLPQPAEDEFLGMWMEGEGGWNGLYKQQAAAAWQPHYAAHLTAFEKHWRHLLTMVPVEELKAMQQKEKKRRSSRGGRASGGGGDSDPEFRVRKTGRMSHTGAKPKAGHHRQKQQQGTKEGVGSPRAQKQQVPQRVGVPPEIAQAALHAAAKQQHANPIAGRGAAGNGQESGAVGDDYSSELMSHDDGASGQQQVDHWYRATEGTPRRMSSGGQSHAELLLKAAGFTTSTSPTARHHGERSHGQLPSHSDAFGPAVSDDHPAHAAAAALVAAVMAAAAKNGSSSRTASSAAKAAAAGAAVGLGSGASSADSAPAHKETNRGTAVDAPAGDTYPAADAGQEVVSAAVMPAMQASMEFPMSAGARKRPEAVRPVVGDFPVRRTAPYNRQAAEAAAAAAAAKPLAPSGRTAATAAGDGDGSGGDGGAGQEDQSDNSMLGFNADSCQGQRDAVARGAVAGSRAGGPQQRMYLDVNTYAAMGQKLLTHEPQLDAASQQRRQAAAAAGKHQQQQQPRLPSAAASPGVAAPNLPGWPGNRGVDMFSWLQQQARQQPLHSQQPPQTVGGVSGPGLSDVQPGTSAHGPTAPGLATRPRAAAAAGGAGAHLSEATDDALTHAADAVIEAAAKLRSRLETGDKHKLQAEVEALRHAAQWHTPAAARESSTQVPYLAMQSPLSSPGLPLGTGATGAAGSSDSTNLVPVVAKLLKVIGAQMGEQQQHAGPAGLNSAQQQKSSLKQSCSLDRYMGVEAANAAAAAAAGASGNALSSPSAAAVGGRIGSSELLPHVHEYFGCVTALPALQPGELRGGGVTVHPNVVAMYLKQDMETALTLQPWSIVIPPSALRQLRSAHIEPGDMASQLYQLLHASNVLNHHSTNAVAAGAVRGGGVGSMGVSGGYAGMPQDFPARFVNGRMTPDDDPRTDLRGEFMLTALQDIEAGTIIGPWRCYLLDQESYSRLQRTVPPDWQGFQEGSTREHAWLQVLHRYTMSVRVPFLATNNPYGKVLAGNAPMLHLCALGFGNLTSLVNDPTQNPRAGSETVDIAAPNVDLCVVLVNGLPLPVLISTRDIRKGQELLCSYGKTYWQTWRNIIEETGAACADQHKGD